MLMVIFMMTMRESGGSEFVITTAPSCLLRKTDIIFFPSIYFPYPLNPTYGLSQLSLGKTRGTPWTGRQSISGPHRHKRQHCQLKLTPRDNLESPINLTCMFLGGGRKPEYLERIHAYMGRTCTLLTEELLGFVVLWSLVLFFISCYFWIHCFSLFFLFLSY